MAQRESEPVLLYDELARIKQRRIQRAQLATSPGGVHVTNEERQDIADLTEFQQRFRRWVAAHRLAEKIDRMGLDAPSVQRALKEIMRDLDLLPDTNDHGHEGMRR